MKKAIFATTLNLINALEKIKSNEIKEEEILPLSRQLQALFYQLNTVLEKNKVEQIKKAEYTKVKACFEGNFNPEHVDFIVKQLQEFLVELEIETPESVFILTAPFDEDAKTGDGQYAKSLVEGFNKYSNNTPCTWLKLETKDYEIPVVYGLRSIPKGIVPTVAALQPVANGKTVLSRYQFSGDNFQEAKRYLKKNITVRTPQLIYSEDNVLQWIGYIKDGERRFFNRDEVRNALLDVLAKKEEKLEVLKKLEKKLEQHSEIKEKADQLNAKKMAYGRVFPHIQPKLAMTMHVA